MWDVIVLIPDHCLSICFVFSWPSFQPKYNVIPLIQYKKYPYELFPVSDECFKCLKTRSVMSVLNV